PFILTPRLSVPSQTNCASSLVERAAGADLTAERVADMCLFSPAGIPMPARTGMVAGIGAAGTPPPAGQGGLLEEPVPPPRRWSPGRIAADRGGGASTPCLQVTRNVTFCQMRHGAGLWCGSRIGDGQGSVFAAQDW